MSPSADARPARLRRPRAQLAPVWLAVVATALSPAAPAFAAEDGGAAKALADARPLLKKRGLANCQKAASLLDAAAKAAPDNAELALEAANAINCVMRIQTDGNLVLIDGLSDTAAHKKIWSARGPRAAALADQAFAAMPGSIDAAMTKADAFMFKSGAYGILEAIFKGMEGEFLENARRINRIDARHDNGVGYIFIGSFYTAAPWPKRDLDEARRQFAKAYAIGKTKRNAYYMGVVEYRDENWAKASEYFEVAKTAACPTPTERDFCGAMDREIKRALGLLQKKK